MIIETHAHYDDKAFDEDRKEILQQLPKEGIEYVINVSSELGTVGSTIDLMDEYPYIYGAIGVHPGNTMDLNEERFLWLKEKARHPKNRAIGETGLDYYWDRPDREIQKKWFIRQMEMARELQLPLVIHSRDAANDTYNLMKEAKAEEIGAIIHCFGYGVEQARQYLNMGFHLGIGGVVTFKNGRKLKEVVEFAPLEQLVLETDSPYLTPDPHRGKRNNSLYLKYIAKEIARIKQVDYQTVVKITSDNAKKFYNI